MIKEFRDFIMRGNVLDLAVAVIIGGAFNKIVGSLVNDVIMPLIGAVVNVNFADWKIPLKDAVVEGEKVIQEAVTMNIGMFIQTVIDFLLIAFTIFIIIKMYNNLQKKEEEAPAEPPAPSEEVVLLTEIRDALKNQN